MNKHADWIKKAYKIEMSPLAEDVMEFLGDWYGGIYNFVHRTNVEKINWHDNHYVEVPYSHSLCTYDDNSLTRLVVMAHDRMFRVEIEPRAHRWLTLVFYKRNLREGSIYERLPTIETHIEQIRKR